MFKNAILTERKETPEEVAATKCLEILGKDTAFIRDVAALLVEYADYSDAEAESE